jgi:hypothetical protein
MNVETEHALINVMELFVLQPKDVRMEFVFQFLVLHVSLLKNVGMENVWTSVMTWCVLQLRNVKTGVCVPIEKPCTELCKIGYECRNGICVDKCSLILCPPGQRCSNGACVIIPCSGCKPT